MKVRWAANHMAMVLPRCSYIKVRNVEVKMKSSLLIPSANERNGKRIGSYPVAINCYITDGKWRSKGKGEREINLAHITEEFLHRTAKTIIIELRPGKGIYKECRIGGITIIGCEYPCKASSRLDRSITERGEYNIEFLLKNCREIQLYFY